MPKDYYLVLGISRGADLNKIKKALRRVVKKHHSDVSALQEGAEKFREIREAYETLGDEVKRRRYDEELAIQGSEVRITRVPEIIVFGLGFHLARLDGGCHRIFHKGRIWLPKRKLLNMDQLRQDAQKRYHFRVE